MRILPVLAAATVAACLGARPASAASPAEKPVRAPQAKAADPVPTGTVTPRKDAAPSARSAEPLHAGAGPTAAGGEIAVARNPRVVQEGDRTRFVLDLTRPVEIQSFGLGEPYRVVVELPETRLDSASDGHREGRGLVTSWRFGLFMAGRSRLVFDLAGPVAIERAEVEPFEGGGFRLVVEMKASDRATFLARHVRKPKEVPVAEGVGLLAKGDRETPRPNRSKPMIVIDPGHGGIDVGTRSPATGTFEKSVVLEIAKLLERRLVETGRYEVRMTRQDDTFVPLADRVRIARSHHADLFLSVHADAELDRLVRGATVYTLDDRASDSQAAALASKENASDALAGVVPEETFDEVADILIDLTLRETKRFSQVLARNLVEDLKTVGRLVKANPHRSANFRVLKAHDIPSALVELGFLSNKEDEQLLMSADWRDKTTRALVASVDRFFQSRTATGPN